MLRFTKNFATDFDLLAAGLCPDPQNPPLPFAFARYGDGEAAICFGKSHRAKSDGWHWQGQQSSLPERLRETLRYTAYGYYVGIVAEAHDAPSHYDLLAYTTLQDEAITFGEIFCFSNYKRFRALPLRESCYWVGPSKCDAYVPPDAVETGWDHLPLVRSLLTVRKPIIVAAGPIANLIVCDYWKMTAKRPAERQTIVDVGSAVAQMIYSHRTRRHHNPSHHLHNWSPTWKLVQPASEAA